MQRASLLWLCSLGIALMGSCGPVSANEAIAVAHSTTHPEEVASLAAIKGARPAGSPIGLYETITRGVTATDIQTAWNGGREIGWIYTGSDGHAYWQDNYAYQYKPWVPPHGRIVSQGNKSYGHNAHASARHIVLARAIRPLANRDRLR